jgi:PAS domain S-box-containing protein
MARLTITVNDKIQNLLKAEAAMTGKTMRTIIEDAILAHLDPDKITIALPDDLRPAWAEYLRDFPGVSLKQAYDWALRGDFTAKGYPNSADGQVNVSELPDVMAHVISPAGVIEGVSELWLETLGYERHEVENHLLREFMTPQSQKLLDHNIKHVAIEKRPSSFEREMVCKDTTVLRVRFALNKRYNDQGRAISAISTLTVIDE